jgi:ribosomal protein S12 methylthiotransferase
MLTLGCPKNEADSERFAQCFLRAGWTITEDPDSADLILLNTCAFIRPAVEESVDTISSLLSWKSEVQGRKLILAGCLPGRYGDDGSGGLDDFELIAGPGDMQSLASWLGLHGSGEFPQCRGKPSRYLRIADGCSNRCSYCTIPLIRGDFRPVDRETILAGARGLVDAGAVEIGLVAQDSAMWSQDGAGLEDLVCELAELHRDTWWRIYYIHPAHFPKGLPGLIESHDNIMPYVDMPIQHVSPVILERMSRSYGPDDLQRILESLDHASRKIAARITVIAGYPGETDSEFSELLDFLCGHECIRNLVAFPYYPEEGTLEYERMRERKDGVPQHVTSERLSLVSAVSESMIADWGEWLHGREITVLADTECSGHTVWDAPFVDCGCLFTRDVEPGSLVSGRVKECIGSDTVLEPGHHVPGFSTVSDMQ